MGEQIVLPLCTSCRRPIDPHERAVSFPCEMRRSSRSPSGCPSSRPCSPYPRRRGRRRGLKSISGDSRIFRR
ncbi:MAG: hypothetical protein B6U65_01210 [Candidatus Wolframiiraptor sp. EX4484-121]|nr:MAG: hypothetical protein B6U65_01210 [Candidatus Wolframiiraptor sp. EX4484-121]